MTDPIEQITQLKAGIEALEIQRSILSDVTVGSGLKGMREQLAELESESSPAPQSEGERRQAIILYHVI